MEGELDYHLGCYHFACSYPLSCNHCGDVREFRVIVDLEVNSSTSQLDLSFSPGKKPLLLQSLQSSFKMKIHLQQYY